MGYSCCLTSVRRRATRVALPIPISVCSIFVCPNTGMAASLWEVLHAHRCAGSCTWGLCGVRRTALQVDWGGSLATPGAQYYAWLFSHTLYQLSYPGPSCIVQKVLFLLRRTNAWFIIALLFVAMFSNGQFLYQILPVLMALILAECCCFPPSLCMMSKMLPIQCKEQNYPPICHGCKITQKCQHHSIKKKKKKLGFLSVFCPACLPDPDTLLYRQHTIVADHTKGIMTSALLRPVTALLHA